MNATNGQRTQATTENAIPTRVIAKYGMKVALGRKERIPWPIRVMTIPLFTALIRNEDMQEDKITVCSSMIFVVGKTLRNPNILSWLLAS